MSGLKNTVRRMFNVGRGKGYQTNVEAKQQRQRKTQSKLDEIYAGAQIPDAELIQRNERRKAAKRRGSRLATVLTDEDTLG